MTPNLRPEPAVTLQNKPSFARLRVEALPLPGLKLVRPQVFGDARGFLLESYHAPRYREAGIDCDFVQDNHSRSTKGVLRGMHFQSRPGQAKLVRVTAGSVFDVCVDLRPSSPTFGRWHGQLLDAEEHVQLFIPVGAAHGFCVLSDTADVLYKTSTVYDPEQETGFSWNDAEIGIKWPLAQPLLSQRDAEAPPFARIRRTLLERS